MTKLSMSKHEDIPAVYAYERHFSFDSGTQLRQNLESFVLKLTFNLKKEGCKVIGHIKGFIGTGTKASLFFNLTSFDQEVFFRGQLPDNVGDCRLVLNVIVYGISQEQVKIAVLESAVIFSPVDK